MRFRPMNPMSPFEQPQPPADDIHDQSNTDTGGSSSLDPAVNLVDLYERGGVNSSLFVKRGLTLYAQRIDDSRARQGKERKMVAALDILLARESEQASQSFFLGYHCDIQEPIGTFFAKDEIRAFEKLLTDQGIDKKYLYRPFIQLAIADPSVQDRMGRFSHWKALSDDIDEACVPDNIRTYLYLVKVSNAVREYIRDKIWARIEKVAAVDILGSPNEFWEHILLGKAEPGKPGKEGLFMSLGYLKRINELRDALGSELFGEESVDARTATQALVYMRTSKTIRKLGELRIPALIFLGRREILPAMECIKIVSLEYPNTLTPITHRQLELSQDTTKEDSPNPKSYTPYIRKIKALLNGIPEAQPFLTKLDKKNSKARDQAALSRVRKIQSEEIDRVVAEKIKTWHERENILAQKRKTENILKLSQNDQHKGHVLVGHLDSPGLEYRFYYIDAPTGGTCTIRYPNINSEDEIEYSTLSIPFLSVREYSIPQNSNDARFLRQKTLSYFEILSALYERTAFDFGIMGNLSESFIIDNAREIAERIQRLKP